MLTLRGEVLGDYETALMLHIITGTNFDFDALGQSLDCSRDFYGAGIIYSENGHNFLIRPSRTNNLTTHIVVNKMPHVNRQIAEQELKKTVLSQSPSLGIEIAGMALSCGGLALGVVATITTAGAIPFTFGASGVISALALAGTIATAVQCINGIGRVIDVAANEGKLSIWLDSHEWYTTRSNILDIISLASAGDALKEAYFTWKASKGVMKKMIDWLKTLNWHERRRLTEALMRKYNPGISEAAIKAFIKAGKYPNRYPSDLVRLQLQKQLIMSVNSMVAFSGSAVSGVLHAPVVDAYEYSVGLIQPFEVLK